MGVWGEPFSKLKGHVKKHTCKIRVESDQAILVNRRETLSLNFRWDLGQAERGGLESEGRLEVHDVIKRRTVGAVERKVSRSE